MSKKPTESQIRVVMSDWLGTLRQKDEGNYTHKSKGGIRRDRNDEGISEYLLSDVNGLDKVELLKQSRQAAEHVVNAIIPEPAQVLVGQGDSYHTQADGKHLVCLATDYFDDLELSNREKLDVMLGLASHEGAHGAYTDSTGVEEKINAEEPALRDLMHQIWNVIEDERIEYLLGDNNPGLSDLLSATKGYYFDKMVNDMKTNGQMPTERLPKLLSTLTLAVRYPSQMDRGTVEENFEELNEIRKILTPYPLTNEATLEATEKVMDVIRKIAEDKAKEKKEQQQGQQQNQSSAGAGQDGSQGTDQNGSTNGQSSQKQETKKKSTKPTKKEIEEALQEMLGSQETKNVLNAIKKDSSKSSGENMSNVFQFYQGENLARYCNEDDSETLSAGSGKLRTFIFKPKGDQPAYADSLGRVRAYIPAMSKVLSCKGTESDYILRGLPSGKLNTNRLVAYRIGNENIFSKEGTITCSSASVAILIDESGSMNGKRMLAARDTAVLINEAIKRIPNVNFYCYGYTDDELTVYSENNRSPKWAIGSTRAKGGTPTGRAMALAAQRVRKFTKDPVILFVLTDGAPDSLEEVIKQDGLLRKQKIESIGVGIQTDLIKNSFQEYVVMRDISNLAMEIGQITKNKLNKITVRHDSMG